MRVRMDQDVGDGDGDRRRMRNRTSAASEGLVALEGSGGASGALRAGAHAEVGGGLGADDAGDGGAAAVLGALLEDWEGVEELRMEHSMKEEE